MKRTKRRMSHDQYMRIRCAIARAVGGGAAYPDGLPEEVLMRLIQETMVVIEEELGKLDVSLPF